MTIGNYYLDPVRSLQCVGVPNKIAKMEGHDINDNGSKNDNPSKDRPRQEINTKKRTNIMSATRK